MFARGLTDIVDMLTVGRSIGSVDTSSNTEVVYKSALLKARVVPAGDILEDMKLVHS